MARMYDSEEGYDLYSPYYKGDHFFLDSFDWEIVIDFFKQSIEGHSHIDLMVLGCGDGREIKRFIKAISKTGKSYTFHGMDISEKMIQLMKKSIKKEGIPLQNIVKANVLDRFDEQYRERFNLITGLFLIVHLSATQIDPFFDNIRYLLNEKGFFIFNNIPQKDLPLLRAGKHEMRILSHHHEDSVIEKKLYEHGFSIKIKRESFEQGIKISTVYCIQKEIL